MKKLFLFLFFLLWPFFCFGAEMVNINKATITQLDALIGIGPVLGQKIIDNRPYVYINDLLKVKGIGPKNLEKIKQQGLACIACQTEQDLSTTTQNQIENVSTTIPTPTTTTANSPDANQDDPPASLSEALRAGRPGLHHLGNVFINEVLPSPEGNDTENEWVEIWNANNFAIDLAGWKLQDKIGAVKTYVFPQNTTIQDNGFLVLNRQQTKISLNNTGDGLELLNPNNQIIDSVNFEKAKQGQSWNKVESNYFWSSQPTPGKQNIIKNITVNSTTSLTNNFPVNNLLAQSQNFVATSTWPVKNKNLTAVAIASALAGASALIAWRIKRNSSEI